MASAKVTKRITEREQIRAQISGKNELLGFLTGAHMPLLFDKGTVRLASQMKVEKGKWYFGFICKECGEKIFSLENPNQITGTSPPIAIGTGKISVPCRSCGDDEILYATSDLLPVQADKDEAASPALPRRKPSGHGRQKLSNRYPKARATFGPRFIEDRPECAVIIARCAATWSYIEAGTALLLATMLKINTEPAVAMFLAMQNSRTQIDVLTAAAETVLSDGDKKLFHAIMKIRKTMESARNDLIHGIFGGSVIVKDGILWTTQKDFTRHIATVVGTDFTRMKTKYGDEVFVYEVEDLETLAEDLEWLYELINSFRGYIGASDAVWRAERYRQLCAEPRIHKALSR